MFATYCVEKGSTHLYRYATFYLCPFPLSLACGLEPSLCLFISPWLNPLQVAGQSTVLGFVGAPWTLATYCVEGGTTRTYTVIKSMIHSAPELLRSLLSHLAKEIGEYAAFQVGMGVEPEAGQRFHEGLWRRIHNPLCV